MFTIDFTKPWMYTTSIAVHQGNLASNNILRCRVITGGDTNLEGYSSSVTFTPNGGKEINGYAKIIDASNSVVDIHFPSNALIVSDNNKFEIILTKGNGADKVVPVSPIITYSVWKGLTTGSGIEANNNYPILIGLISDVNTAITGANNAKDEALEAAKKALIAADKAEGKNIIVDDKVEKNSVWSSFKTDSEFNSIKARLGNMSMVKCQYTKSGTVNNITLKGKSLANINKAPSISARFDNMYYQEKQICSADLIELNTPYTLIIYKTFNADHNSAYNLCEFGIGNSPGYIDSHPSMTIDGTKKFNFQYNTNIKSEVIVKRVVFENLGGKKYLSWRPVKRQTPPVTGQYADYILNSMLIKGDHTQNPPNTYFEGMASVGTGVSTMNISSLDNRGSLEPNIKPLMFKDTDNALKPIPELRGINSDICDAILEGQGNKYYYYQRVEKRSYVQGDELLKDVITDKTYTISKLSKDNIFETSDINLVSCDGGTIVKASTGVIDPFMEFRISSYITDLVWENQQRIKLLEEAIFNTNKTILNGDMRSLAEITYPGDFEENKAQVLI